MILAAFSGHSDLQIVHLTTVTPSCPFKEDLEDLEDLEDFCSMGAGPSIQLIVEGVRSYILENSVSIILCEVDFSALKTLLCSMSQQGHNTSSKIYVTTH